MSIQYKGEWPEEVLPSVKSILDKEAWLIPGWCQDIFIHWNCEAPESGVNASVDAYYDYRWVRLDLYPGWLNGDGNLRREDIIHELIHISVNPALDYAEKTLKELLEEDAPKFHKSVKDQFRALAESAVQDLTYSIAKRIP